MPLGFYGYGKILGRARRAAIRKFNYGRKKKQLIFTAGDLET